MENFKKITKQQSPARTIAFGFAVLIFIGAALLSLPIAVRGAVQLPGLDALFTATSAVCVTGLVMVDPGDTFTLFGQAVLAVLMQLGGLGISSVSMGLAIAAGRRISFRGRSLVREALNVESFGGMVKLVRTIMAMTLLVEGIGAVASYPVFARDYSPLHAAWISVFHAIASFNNAGLDVLGGGHSLIPYCNNLWLNLVTDGMIVLGGIGFMVMLDVLRCRGRFRKLTLHSKVVLSTTAVLILGGAMLLWLTEPISFLAALFQSITTRTAGFSTIDIGAMTNAGLLVIMILMFIGASPGSTGGGIKTTTFFVLMQEVRIIFSKRRLGAFRRRLPEESLAKAATITLLGTIVVFVGTFMLCVLEPQHSFVQLLFEQISAYSTAGLSMGITSSLHAASKAVLIVTMFIGRVGAFTLLSLWVSRPEPSAKYTEEAITIG